MSDGRTPLHNGHGTLHRTNTPTAHRAVMSHPDLAESLAHLPEAQRRAVEAGLHKSLKGDPAMQAAMVLASQQAQREQHSLDATAASLQAENTPQGSLALGSPEMRFASPEAVDDTPTGYTPRGQVSRSGSGRVSFRDQTGTDYSPATPEGFAPLSPDGGLSTPSGWGKSQKPGARLQSAGGGSGGSGGGVVSSSPGGGDCDVDPEEPMRDPFFGGYLIMVLQGCGMLFPWNAFISSEVYLRSRLAGSGYDGCVENYTTFAFQISNFTGLAVTVFYLGSVSARARMLAPLAVMALVFVAFTWLTQQTAFPAHKFFFTMLALVAVTGFGTAAFQGGTFAMVATLPARYSQAVMSGQALAGVVTSLLSLSFVTPNKTSAAIYFGISIGVLVLCILAFFL